MKAMRLTDAEFQVFKTHFHCTAWWDEEYRTPCEVETPSGNATWRAYTSGAKFHAGVDWLKQWRRAKSGSQAVDTQPEPVAVPQSARVQTRIGWPRRVAFQIRTALSGR